MGKKLRESLLYKLSWHYAVLPEEDMAFPSINGLWFWELSHIQKLFIKLWLIEAADTSPLLTHLYTHIYVHTYVLSVGEPSSHLASKSHMTYLCVLAIHRCKPGLLVAILTLMSYIKSNPHYHWWLNATTATSPHIFKLLLPFLTFRDPRARLGYRKHYWTYWSHWCRTTPPTDISHCLSESIIWAHPRKIAIVCSWALYNKWF